MPADYHADLVLTLGDRGPRLVVVVEVQLGRADDKRYTWPHYAIGMRTRFRCPCVVLVITPDAGVAEWAQEVIDLGGGSRFTPVVIGPEQIPAVTDPAVAVASPDLAVLSALAHRGGAKGLDVVRAALEGVSNGPRQPRLAPMPLS